MTDPDPVTEAEGTVTANPENIPSEDNTACGTSKNEDEKRLDADGQKEAKEEKSTDGKEESEDKKILNKKNDEEEMTGGEVDGAEVFDGKKECEIKENRVKKKEGNAINDAEEKDSEHQNGLTHLENTEGVKDDTQTVNTAETEDVKMGDEEHVKGNDAQDAKMEDADDVKDEKGGTETDEQVAQDRTENDVNKVVDGEAILEKISEDKEADGPKNKRPRSKKVNLRKDMKGGETRAKELLCSPSSIDRPVRERKTVERLVEVIEKEPNREFQVEKGRGTPLKDIPNVAHKLAKKKPADIKLIHQTLFGRRGKAINFKSHILQFSGFVWHESDEKQKAKMKEKLDKYVKDTLLDLCDLFDLPFSRANSRKEDLVAKLLDFMVSPHPTTDDVLAEGQISRKRKRMARGNASKGRRWVPTRHSRKQTKNEDTTAKESSAQETEDDEEEEKDEKDGKDEMEDKENDLSEKEKVDKHSMIEEKESESEESTDQEDDEDGYEEKLGKGKNNKKRAIKKQGSTSKEKLKVASIPKSSLPTTTKSPTKRSYTKRAKGEADRDSAGAKVSTTKNSFTPKKKSTYKSNAKEKTADKKKAGREKTKQLVADQPSKVELKKKICEILKEADFNTATFTDILKRLATHYKTDLTPRKATLKLMIQEELTKLAEADEDEEDENDDNNDEKERKTVPKGKEVEA